MTRRLRVGRHASPRQIRGHRPGTPGESARVLRPGHALSMRHASTAGRGNGLDSESASRAAPGPQATADGTRHRAQVHAVAGRASLGVGHVALWGLREVAHRGWGAYHQPGCRRKAPARLDCSAFERRPYLHADPFDQFDLERRSYSAHLMLDESASRSRTRARERDAIQCPP